FQDAVKESPVVRRLAEVKSASLLEATDLGTLFDQVQWVEQKLGHQSGQGPTHQTRLEGDRPPSRAHRPGQVVVFESVEPNTSEEVVGGKLDTGKRHYLD